MTPQGTQFSNVVALILAGGRGERFWPKSRKKSPKYLLTLGSKSSLLEQTIKRLKGLVKNKNIWIVTNREQVPLIKKSWRGKFSFHMLIEPEGRNTAAAIGLAAIKIKKIYGENVIMLVLSADHWIKKEREFKDSLRCGIDLCNREKALVTVGVRATRPETGFGYIEKGKPHLSINRVYKARRFIEKPNLSRAKKIYCRLKYLWNSGIFVWKIEDILQAFRKYLPRHFKLLSQIDKESIGDIYCRIKKISIDYGIMERAKNVWVVEGKFLWEDVGSWDAWAGFKEKDNLGNIKIGNIISVDTEHCNIWSDKQLVATLGINNLNIIANEDAVLICKKGRSQEIKKIVAGLNKKKKWQKYI